MKIKKEYLDNNYILERIEVQPPYFAIEKMKLQNERSLIRAQIPIQQPLGLEWSYITAAEAGRHLAILGSCFLSSINNQDGKFYYLAHEAKYESSLSSIKRNSSYLLGSATGRFLEKRSAEANAQLMTIENELVCNLNIKYHVFSEKIFQKLYYKYKQPLVDYNKNLINPYSNIPILNDVQFSDDLRILYACLEKIDSKNCLGHFPLFPAMPIAILAHYLISLSGFFLEKILNKKNVKYHVKTVELLAPDLGFANEKIKFRINYLRNDGELFYFCCKAIVDSSKTIGELNLTLKVII